MNENLLDVIDLLMRGDPAPDTLRGQALLILAALQERDELLRSVRNYRAMESAMLAFTSQWDEHPESWGDLACECRSCLSYADSEPVAPEPPDA